MCTAKCTSRCWVLLHTLSHVDLMLLVVSSSVLAFTTCMSPFSGDAAFHVLPPSSSLLASSPLWFTVSALCALCPKLSSAVQSSQGHRFIAAHRVAIYPALMILYGQTLIFGGYVIPKYYMTTALIHMCSAPLDKWSRRKCSSTVIDAKLCRYSVIAAP